MLVHLSDSNWIEKDLWRPALPRVVVGRSMIASMHVKKQAAEEEKERGGIADKEETKSKPIWTP